MRCIAPLFVELNSKTLFTLAHRLDSFKAIGSMKSLSLSQRGNNNIVYYFLAGSGLGGLRKGKGDENSVAESHTESKLTADQDK